MTWGMSKVTTAFPAARAGYGGGGGGGGGYSNGGYSQGGGYSNSGYSGGGYSGGFGGVLPAQSQSGGNGGWLDAISSLKTNDNSAALNALTLISFLYFLNMLQTQLLSSGSQTLVFTVGSTGGTNNGTFNGRRRRSTSADDEVWGRDYAYEVQSSQEYQRHLHENFWIPDDDLAIIGADSGAGRPITDSERKQATTTAAPTQSLLRDKGEVDEVVGVLRALLPAASSLPLHLTNSLPRCSAVVACTMHRATSKPVLSEHAITTIELAGGTSDLDEACENVLTSDEGECGELAQILGENVPKSLQSNNLKHDPHEFL